MSIEQGIAREWFEVEKQKLMGEKRELMGLTYSVVEMLYVVSVSRKFRDGMTHARAIQDMFFKLHGLKLGLTNVRQELGILSKEKFISWIFTGDDNLLQSRVAMTPKGFEELNRRRADL